MSLDAAIAVAGDLEPNIPSGSAATLTWWEHYGPIGVVAGLALAALAFVVKYYLNEKREREKREEAQRAALQAMIDAQQASLVTLNRQMVEMVQTAHDETMSLLNQQRDDHERRFQALLERHMTMTDKWSEKTQEIAAVVSKAIESLSRRLGGG